MDQSALQARLADQQPYHACAMHASSVCSEPAMPDRSCHASSLDGTDQNLPAKQTAPTRRQGWTKECLEVFDLHTFTKYCRTGMDEMATLVICRDPMQSSIQTFEIYGSLSLQGLWDKEGEEELPMRYTSRPVTQILRSVDSEGQHDPGLHFWTTQIHKPNTWLKEPWQPSLLASCRKAPTRTACAAGPKQMSK